MYLDERKVDELHQAARADDYTTRGQKQSNTSNRRLKISPTTQNKGNAFPQDGLPLGPICNALQKKNATSKTVTASV